MKVVILDSAAQDLKDLRTSHLREGVVKNFSQATWLRTYSKLKESIRNLATFPLLGAVPPELETLSLNQYRQVISGMNRVIYEPRADAVYIYMIVDTRRDLETSLMQRLMR
jgi:plasmid stabilization system protein ParE